MGHESVHFTFVRGHCCTRITGLKVAFTLYLTELNDNSVSELSTDLLGDLVDSLLIIVSLIRILENFQIIVFQ